MAEDARQGYVSIEGAEKDYGVRVDPSTFAVDVESTKALRSGKGPAKDSEE